MVMVAACTDDEEKTVPEYAVSVAAGEHGTAVADPAKCVAGGEVTLTATPENGYVFVEWTVTSGEVELSDPTANPVKFTMPEGDVAFAAAFEKATVYYPITLADAEHGTISATLDGEEEMTEATEGANIVLAATPDEGYEFAGWTITGVEIPAEDVEKDRIAFAMPAGEVTVEAKFQEEVNVLDLIADPTFKAYAQQCMENGEDGEIDGEAFKQPMWDTNLDGKLSVKEAAEVKLIDLNTYYNENSVDYVTSLAGIEYFTGLQKLDISNFVIDDETYTMAVDLSACEGLIELLAEDCGYGLTKVVLGEKPELKRVNLAYCWDLTELGLADSYPKLEEFSLTSDYLETVDLSCMPALKMLDLQLSSVSGLDFSANTELTALYLSCESLGTLDISPLTKLTTLNCTGCGLKTVDISTMAFNEEGTYTAYVGRQETDRYGQVTMQLDELLMRADQKAHWDEVLAADERNEGITKVTVIE